jgi:UDP-N-acetyl-D-glucosamine dehydrogenase
MAGRGTRDFADRVRSGDATVAIVGLGYVGLPLAMAFADSGLRTIGLDVDEARVAALQAGRSHVDDVPDSMLSAADCFEATADPAALTKADAIFLCVPTPFDATKTPVLDYVRAASATVGAGLVPGQLVILQSTTSPGTTTDIVQPILEAASGLRAGVDFHLAYSPERVDPANTTWTLANTPKVCGGITAECGEMTRALLSVLLDDPSLVTVVSSPKVAEMSKLIENTYRAVNIAYVNELAMLAHEMDVDIWEVIEAAGTKPFGFQSFMPGIGPGGQCIPVNPYYISWKAREFDFHASFIELAGDINLRMKNYVMHRIHSFTTRLGITLAGARVLCLGAAFKAGVSDVRNSRAVRVMELLRREGAHVEFADPLVDSLRVAEVEQAAVPLDGIDYGSYDLIVVLVRNPVWDVEAILASGTPTFDAVNALGAPTAGAHERL